MSGWLTNGVDTLPVFSGAERLPLDTNLSAGQNPQSASVSVERLATLASYYSSSASKTTVAGTRYIRSVNVGWAATLNGVAVSIGSAGGTDKFIVELHDSTGALVATSRTDGTTSGSANTWQQIPFGTSGGAVPYVAQPGLYFIALQSNGTTDHPLVYNSPTSPLLSGTAAGTFGTGAAITPPTAYVQAAAPVSLLY